MPSAISSKQLISWVHKLTHFVIWLSVALLHSSLLCILITALYLSGISGSDIYNSIAALTHNLGLSKAWQGLSFFGVSGAAIVSVYAVAVKKIVMYFSLKYLINTPNDHEQ